MNTKIMSECPLCGDAGQVARNAMLDHEALVPGAGVGCKCAERIANAFSKKHSGDWLTWPNEAHAASRKKKATIGPALRTAVFERDLYRCLRCGTHLNLRVDHIDPESKGGNAVFENLQTLCTSCNSWKGVKAIDFRRADA